MLPMPYNSLLQYAKHDILGFMSVKEIKLAITQLSSTELAELAEWFEEFHAEAWDKQLEKDVEAGRLDQLIQQAEAEFEAGQCKPL
jgi:hypothetical protein